MSKVEITVGSWGQGSLLVDGDDISKAVSGFSLQTRVGTVPVLRVDLLAEPTYLTGEMDVRMAVQGHWSGRGRAVRRRAVP